MNSQIEQFSIDNQMVDVNKQIVQRQDFRLSNSLNTPNNQERGQRYYQQRDFRIMPWFNKNKFFNL